MSRLSLDRLFSGAKAQGLGAAIALTALGGLSACGAPGRVDVCHASCNAQLRCKILNDIQTQNCHNDCEGKSGTYSDEDSQLAKMCTNVGDIRKQQVSCYDVSCDLSGIISASGCLATAVNNYCLKP